MTRKTPHLQKNSFDFASRLYGSGILNTPQKSVDIAFADFKFWANEWIESGARSGISKRTSETRREVLDKLEWFLESVEFAKCGVFELNQFFGYCQTGHKTKWGRWDSALKINVGKRAYEPLSDATIWTYYAYLKGFFSFLVRRAVLTETPFLHVDKPVQSKNKPQPFTESQIEALLRAAKKSAVPARNEALVWFLLDSGARVSEVCSLTLGDVDFSDERSLTFRVTGKGRKKRVLRLGKRATDALWTYFKSEHGIKRRFNKVGRGERSSIDASTPVFMSTGRAYFGEPLTRCGVLHIISELGKNAGIGGVRCSPHTFRHTFAITYLRNGGDVFTLRDLLGHSNLRTVEIYLSLAESDVAEGHRKFSPGDSLRR